MDDLLSEKEQLEQMRNWWSDNGAFVIGGIVAGALILFGINYFQSSKLNAQLEASALFEDLAEAVADHKLEAAESALNELEGKYSDTSYMAQSRLAMARLYMDKSRDQDAADSLLALLDQPGNDHLKHVGRLRLAKIYLYQEKAQEAVDLLQGQDNAAFAARNAEALGDAYTMLGNVSEAEAAYQAALGDEFAARSINRSLVQWKILDLPKPPETPAEETGESGMEEGE